MRFFLGTHCGGRRCALPPAPPHPLFFSTGSPCYLLFFCFLMSIIVYLGLCVFEHALVWQEKKIPLGCHGKEVDRHWRSDTRSRRRKSTRFQRRKHTRSRRLFTYIDNMHNINNKNKSTAVSTSTTQKH